MLRYLTERLPAMVCPRWVRTRIQPVALDDLLAYLEQSLHVAPGIYEIGGADVTTYREMIAAYARVRGLRPRRIIDIPWLTPHLSSYWVDLVTPVDRSVSHALIESLVTEVVVVDPEPARRAFSVTPMGVERARGRARRPGRGSNSLVVRPPNRPGRRRLLCRRRCRHPARYRGRGRSRSGDDRRAIQLVRRCARVDGPPCPRAPRRRTPSTTPARGRRCQGARRLVAHRPGRVGRAGAAERRDGSPVTPGWATGPAQGSLRQVAALGRVAYRAFSTGSCSRRYTAWCSTGWPATVLLGRRCSSDGVRGIRASTTSVASKRPDPCVCSPG